ncbi:epoxyqueuosine reductase QueH [bacterium]|nr:epoxyqueuosine reductase QueH [bacterium]
MEQKENKVLLHACCAICSAYPIELLKDMGYVVVVYFYNPNIYPASEYQKRLEAERKLCKAMDVELIEEIYDENDFLKYVKGYEDCPEKGDRCPLCFELRLRKSAETAKNLGIKNFTTSIVISPHKNFTLLSGIGKNIARDTNLNYLDIDFKKQDGFLKTNIIAKDLNLYRQNYCGCRFSQR